MVFKQRQEWWHAEATVRRSVRRVCQHQIQEMNDSNQLNQQNPASCIKKPNGSRAKARKSHKLRTRNRPKTSTKSHEIPISNVACQPLHSKKPPSYRDRPRQIEKHNHGKCFLCKGAGKAWKAPTRMCSVSGCNNQAHWWCDPVGGYPVPSDFSDVPMDNILTYHYECQMRLAKGYKCAECSSKTKGWNKLDKEYEKPNGDKVVAYKVRIDRAVKKIYVTEKVKDDKEIFREYPIRKSAEASVELQKVEIKKDDDPDYAVKRFCNQELIDQSCAELGRLAGTKYKNMCSKPNPRYFEWQFKDSGVQTGVITVENGFKFTELQKMMKLMEFAEYKPKEDWPQELRRLSELDEEAVDWTEMSRKTQARLKIEAEYKYSYHGPKKQAKWHKLNKSNIKLEDIPIAKFVDLRMRGLFKNRKSPFKQHQYNYYNDLSGISQHADELRIFVYLLVFKISHLVCIQQNVMVWSCCCIYIKINWHSTFAFWNQTKQ